MKDYSKLWGERYSIYASQHEGCSESIVLSLILERFPIDSMVDFGCAIGRWCLEAKRLGMTEVLGIDGPYVNQESLVIDKREFLGRDLSKPIELSKRYDLAVSLEVAEHLPEESSDIFVDNLTRASDIVLFSAAVQGQGGDFHLNEQPMSYWQKKFEQKGYVLYDYLRPIIWQNDKVQLQYRQNCVLYLRRQMVDSTMLCLDKHIVDMVHPEVFWGRMRAGYVLFPFHLIERNSRIVLYGAGMIGNSYYRQLQAVNCYRELTWVDQVRRQACVDNQAIEVDPPDILAEIEADFYIIAIGDEKTAQQVVHMLHNSYAIGFDKIIHKIIKVTL